MNSRKYIQPGGVGGGWEEEEEEEEEVSEEECVLSWSSATVRSSPFLTFYLTSHGSFVHSDRERPRDKLSRLRDQKHEDEFWDTVRAPLISGVSTICAGGEMNRGPH